MDATNVRVSLEQFAATISAQMTKETEDKPLVCDFPSGEIWGNCDRTPVNFMKNPTENGQHLLQTVNVQTDSNLNSGPDIFGQDGTFFSNSTLYQTLPGDALCPSTSDYSKWTLGQDNLTTAVAGDVNSMFKDFTFQSQQNLQIFEADFKEGTNVMDEPLRFQFTGLPEMSDGPRIMLLSGKPSTQVIDRQNMYHKICRGPPPRVCVICGDEASGCHYGALTCGSCKVFFKRAVEGRQTYSCAGRNDCIVDKKRRRNCPGCRLRKCYHAGMILGGRRGKRFTVLKAIMIPGLQRLPGKGQTIMPLSGLDDIQLVPQIISVLENIEPQVVYADYDNSQPDTPNLLLNSLNLLGERQLVYIVKWSKSLPGFRRLHISDQMALIQYSWMSLMVFSLGWRSFLNVTSECLYFAPDLILNEERMQKSPIYDLCSEMKFIPKEFAKLQVTKEEFLCMKVLLLLGTVPLEGLKSQSQFEEMRQNYIHELRKAIHLKEQGLMACTKRFYHLTKLLDHMHYIVQKLNLYCLSTFIQAEAMRVEFPEMMSEMITTQLPNILAGMVRPLLFHAK